MIRKAFLVPMLSLLFLAGSSCQADDIDSMTEAFSDQGIRAMDRGDIKAAKKLFKKALGLDTDESHEKLYLARLYNNIGECYRHLSSDSSYEIDRYDEEEQLLTNNKQLLNLAEKYLKRSLEIKEEVLSTDTVVIARSLENLGRVYFELEDLDEAEGLYRKALNSREFKYGKETEDTASDYLMLGDIYSHQKRKKYKDAEKNYLTALRIWSRTNGPLDPLVGKCHQKLALNYFRANDLDRSGASYDRAVLIFTKNGKARAVNLAELKTQLKDLPEDCYANLVQRLRKCQSNRNSTAQEIQSLKNKLCAASLRVGRQADADYLRKHGAKP